MKFACGLAFCLMLNAPLALAWDCDTGIYPGIGESNGISLHATCGKGWRVILSTPLKQDDDDWWGYTNNSYDFMIGVEYQWRWKKLRFEAGMAYINEEIKLYDQEQYPLWLRIGYEIFPSVYCGAVHTSIVFVDDAGRNQVGCDYTFRFD